MQPAQGNPTAPQNAPGVNPTLQPSVSPPTPPISLNSASPPVPPPPPPVEPGPTIVASNPAYGGFRALNEDLSAPKVELPTDFSTVKPGDETSFNAPIKLNNAPASTELNPSLNIVDDQLTTFGSNKSTTQRLITQTLMNAQFAWDEAKKGTDPEFVKRAQEAVGKALENDLTSILNKEYKTPTPDKTWK
jgi:hypothetical protein